MLIFIGQNSLSSSMLNHGMRATSKKPEGFDVCLHDDLEHVNQNADNNCYDHSEVCTRCGVTTQTMLTGVCRSIANSSLICTVCMSRMLETCSSSD